jgi:hypothetical protein
MLTSEQVNRIELQCWKERLVAAMCAILAVRGSQPRATVAAELDVALGACDVSGDGNSNDVRAEFVKRELLGPRLNTSMLFIHTALTRSELNAAEVESLMQLISSGE